MKFVRYVFHGSSSPCPGGGKRRFAFGIWAALLAVAVVVGSVSVAAATSTTSAVTFIDPTGKLTAVTDVVTKGENNQYTLANGKGTVVESQTTTTSSTAQSDNSDGWYVVNTDVAVDSLITVTGTVNLILCDGFTLTAKGGIKVEGTGNSLTIYAGTTNAEAIVQGTGKLTTYYTDGGNKTSSVGENQAGIGASSATAVAGNITINGGVITVKGGSGAPGIGSGKDATNDTCEITINGNELTGSGTTFNVEGGENAPSVKAKSITLNAHYVSAQAGHNDNTTAGAGINADTVTVESGILTAIGGAGANGITAKTSVAVSGGTLNATGGEGNSSNGGNGINTEGDVEITGGTVAARGGAAGTSGTAGKGITAASLSMKYDATDTAILNGAYHTLFATSYNLTGDFTVENGQTFVYKAENATTATDLTVGQDNKVTELDALANQFISPKVYTITFDLNYTDATDTPTAQRFLADAEEANRKATTPTEPTRTEYKLAGWYKGTESSGTVTLEDDAYDFNAAVEADMTLYAVWAKSKCTVTFNANYTGATTQTTTQDIEATETASATALNGTFTRTGYTLAGWNTLAEPTEETPGTSYTPTQAVTIFDLMDDTTLYAQWTLNRYAITYQGVDEATNNNPASYSIESDDFTLNAPTKKGSRFTGWTYTNHDTPEKNPTVTIDKDNPAELTFTANWSKGYVPAENLTTPEFAGHSLMLGEQIGVMFYVYFPGGTTAEGASMTFEINGDETKQTAPTPTETDYVGYTVYGYKCYINSVQMGQTITASLTYTGGNDPITDTYEATTYLGKLTGTDAATTYGTEAVALGNAIKDYGHYVKDMLQECHQWADGKYEPIEAATDYATTYASSLPEASTLGAYKITDDFDASNNDGIADVKFALLLDTKTTIRLYLTPKTGYAGKIIVKLGDEGNDEELTDDNKIGSDYVYEITGISAHQLADTHKVTVTTTKSSGTDTITIENLSALSYAYSVLKGGEDEAESGYTGEKTVTTKMQYAAIALNDYYEKTVAYNTALTNDKESNPEVLGEGNFGEGDEGGE